MYCRSFTCSHTQRNSARLITYDNTGYSAIFHQRCVGCDTVQAEHAPEAGVAQGIFHGILVRHRGRIQEEVEEGLEEEVERRVKRTLKNKCACR